MVDLKRRGANGDVLEMDEPPALPRGDWPRPGQPESVDALQQQLAYEHRRVQLVHRIHAAKTLDQIFLELQGEILGLFDAERLTLFVVNPERKELSSRFLQLDTVKEIRLPLSGRSIAGYVALTGEAVNVADAYDAAELERVSPTLRFDGAWDRKTGFRTAQILCHPIVHETRTLGVIQLLNKKSGGRFTREDEASLVQIAVTLGLAFHNHFQLAQQRRPIKFDYLLAQGRITWEELDTAIAEASRRRVDVESLLIDQYKIPKAEVGVSLSQYYRAPFVEFDDTVVPPEDLVKGLNVDYLKRALWIPIRREEHTVTVLIDNPQDLRKRDEVAQLLPSYTITFAVGLPKDIQALIATASGEAQREVLQRQLASEQRLVQLVHKIHAARTLDQIFLELQAEILSFFDAERLTLFVIHPERRDLASRFLQLDAVTEIRVPISDRSIAGYVALTGRPVNIANAYDAAELQRISPALRFDGSWDRKTGFRTTQVLCYPIVNETRTLGVIQLLNRKRGGPFTAEDTTSLVRIASTLGLAFHNQFQLAQQRRPTKFDYLLARGRISQDTLSAAITEARRRQVDVESLLIEQYKVPKAEVGASLSQYYRVPFLEFDEKIVPPADLIRGLNIDYLKRALWIPIRLEDNTVSVLIDNPQDLRKTDEVAQLLCHHAISFVIGLPRDIQAVISTAAQRTRDASITDILGELTTETTSPVEDAELQEIDENDSAIIRLANQIISEAYRSRASDIHIEPYGPRAETVVRLRVDGQCRDYQKIPAAYRRALVARLKIMAHLDIADHRKFQDGKIRFRALDREIELRVAVVPTADGEEDMVLRVLAGGRTPIPVDRLGLSDRNARGLKALADKPYGLVLVVGPTGSGKTTTLHSVLGHINRPERKIWTAEDPVEITQYGLRQVQIQPRQGITFAMALRGFLRADPDVIMVGEMRDRETAETAIEASLTGHLVLSTLHTNSAVETVIRLLDMGLDPFNFADSLLGVLAQRLVRGVCDTCKEPYQPEQSEYDELVRSYGREDWERQVARPYDDAFTLSRGRGCDECSNTGYRGRAGIHELLLATDEIKQLIQTRTRVSEILAAAKRDGMVTLVQDGILKSLKGVTDFRQVSAVAIK
jgi:type II secretory ATPase GspE/PulE/Tfp pilus assembly ATPase PilB-like protein/GAF domain-containing protein